MGLNRLLRPVSHSGIVFCLWNFEREMLNTGRVLSTEYCFKNISLIFLFIFQISANTKWTRRLY